tara:strand:- start:1422 stop:1574 length:153 start_codon:yes stop_codon:yes gene_type:complete
MKILLIEVIFVVTVCLILRKISLRDNNKIEKNIENFDININNKNGKQKNL